MKIIITIYFALFFVTSMSANANPNGYTECNYDYKEDGFSKFESVLDDNASGVEVIKEERVFHAKDNDSRDVSIDHMVKLKNGTNFAHRILCLGDLVSSFISVYDMKDYKADTDIHDIMKQIEGIIKEMPVKKDNDFREKWERVKRYTIKDAISKNAKFYEMDAKTGKYVELPRECRFLNENNPKCPTAEDMHGYVQVTKEFFNVHIKVEP